MKQERKRESRTIQKDRNPSSHLPEPKKVAILTSNKVINEYQRLVYEFTKSH